MLEKIKNLNWYWQLLILVPIAAIVCYGVRYSVTSATWEEADKTNQEAAAVRGRNEQAEITVQHINEFRALYAAKAQEYDELKVLLPEQREITNVLQGLQDNARDSRLTVMRFPPRDDQIQDSMTAKPVEVEVDSNFTNLRAFFESMAKLPRIVSITDFKLNQLDKQTGPKTLHAQFLLTAYYATPENLVKTAAADEQHGAVEPMTVSPASAPRCAWSSARLSSRRRSSSSQLRTSARRVAMSDGSVDEVASQWPAWHHDASWAASSNGRSIRRRLSSRRRCSTSSVL